MYFKQGMCITHYHNSELATVLAGKFITTCSFLFRPSTSHSCIRWMMAVLISWKKVAVNCIDTVFNFVWWW